jgi:hypothetical protein
MLPVGVTRRLLAYCFTPVPPYRDGIFAVSGGEGE